MKELRYENGNFILCCGYLEFIDFFLSNVFFNKFLWRRYDTYLKNS